MQLNFAATGYRLHAVDAILAEIEGRPAGTRKGRLFDLKAELRDLRIEEIFNVQTEVWRWAVRLDSQHSINHAGERIWEPELRRQDRLDEVRFPTREAAEAALAQYLDAL